MMEDHIPDLQLLQASIDPDSESDFRILVDKRFVKYLTIDAGLFELHEMAFGPTLFSLLPRFPTEEWNKGRISRDPLKGTVYFSSISRVQLPGILTAWHTTHIDHLDLQMGGGGGETSFQRLRGLMLSLQLTSCRQVRSVSMGSASVGSRDNGLSVDRRPTDRAKVSWPPDGGRPGHWNSYGTHCRLSPCYVG